MQLNPITIIRERRRRKQEAITLELERSKVAEELKYAQLYDFGDFAKENGAAERLRELHSTGEVSTERLLEGIEGLIMSKAETNFNYLTRMRSYFYRRLAGPVAYYIVKTEHSRDVIRKFDAVQAVSAEDLVRFMYDPDLPEKYMAVLFNPPDETSLTHKYSDESFLSSIELLGIRRLESTGTFHKREINRFMQREDALEAIERSIDFALLYRAQEDYDHAMQNYEGRGSRPYTPSLVYSFNQPGWFAENEKRLFIKAFGPPEESGVALRTMDCMVEELLNAPYPAPPDPDDSGCGGYPCCDCCC